MSKLEIEFPSAHVYKIGEKITGTVQLTTNVELMECSKLVISLLGIESVRWEDLSLDKNEYSTPNVIYENDRSILTVQEILWAPEEGGARDIPVGTHQYPFSIVIPDENLPTVSKDEYSEIKYTLQCSLEKEIKTRKSLYLNF
jgi:hypothetical protein